MFLCVLARFIKAATSGVACQVCHSTEVVFKAGVQTGMSTVMSSSQRSLYGGGGGGGGREGVLSIEKRGNGVAFMHSVGDKEGDISGI